jgi:uncharacterized protein YndB with AHSA1/START domain
MSSDLEVEREVAAPAERTWLVATDLDRAADVIGGIDRLERLDGGGDLRVGTRWRETRTMMGKQATEEMIVTAVEPGRSYTVEADSRGAHYVSTITVTPLDDDRSRISMSFRGEPGSTVGKVLAATVGRLAAGPARKALKQDLDDIAAAAEAPA